MFDQADTMNFRLTNARIVTPNRVVAGSLSVEDGRIVGWQPGAAGPGIDCDGDFITPGVVDIHTDHAETHVFPRGGVIWDFLNALMAHDSVVIGGGTTTVFDSLSVGASMRRPERRALLVPLVEALERGQTLGLFRADHLLHLRCEICDPDTMALTDATISRPLTRLVSLMDHTPGDRQSPDVPKWTLEAAKDMGITLAEAEDRLAELLDRSARVGALVRAHVVAAARRAGHAAMSHDDRTVAQVDQAVGEGIAVSEFPTTVAAAERAHASGMLVVGGAPNYLRGGSQSGNVSVRELLALGLIDVLASDYIPRSPLDAAFAIAADPALPQDLPAALGMVTRTPALMAGLTDRGAIAPGLRADLVRLRQHGTHLHVRAVWTAGQRVV